MVVGSGEERGKENRRGDRSERERQTSGWDSWLSGSWIASAALRSLEMQPSEDVWSAAQPAPESQGVAGKRQGQCPSQRLHLLTSVRSSQLYCSLPV